MIAKQGKRPKQEPLHRGAASFPMEELHLLQSILERPQRLAILMHHQPDGDTLAAALALTRLCEKEGHTVTLISPNPYPHFFQWMEDIQHVRIFDKEQAALVPLIEKADTLFFMDFIPHHRMGKLAPFVRKSPARKVAIDHHPGKDEDVDLVFCDPTASATCALLYELLLAIGKEAHIDPPLATALYVGICTDTGSFTHANTTSRTHRIAAALMEKGVRAHAVHHAIHGNQSLQKMRFLAHIITHRLVVLPAYRTAYFSIPRKDFLRFQLQPGDKAGIVSHALNLRGISLAALIVEQKEKNEPRLHVSLSLRSVGDIPVNAMSAKYFGGGGHKNAAGALSKRPLPEVNKHFEEMVRQEMPPAE